MLAFSRGLRQSLCLVALTMMPLSGAEAGQQRGGQGGAQAGAPAQAATGQVRVPNTNANVHAGPSSGAELIVVVPKGTVLTVTGRDKEWIQVELTPALRRTSMVMRWYRNENRGWVHDSTVDVVSSGSQRGAPPPR